MRKLATPVLAVIMLTTSSLTVLRSQTADGSDADKAAIQKLFADFNNALNSHDAHATAMFFTEDGDFIGIRGKIVHGRADIQAQLAPLFDGVLKTMYRDATLRGVRFLRPDVAVLYSDYVTTGVAGANGAPGPATKGLYDWVVTKQDGRWLIAVWREANL